MLRESVTRSLVSARAYEEERRRAEALAELDRAKTAFFSNVSHEFRTPLTLILGPLEDALAEAEGGERRDRLELLHRNALRLQKLVNTLLDFSRIEAGRIQASYEPVDLAALTADLASVFRSAVEKAGMRLIVACEPLGGPVYVDRDMYEKVVLNLLSNAFKFTLEGEIEVTLRDAGETAELLVRDTGTGIAEEQLPHIFERFHRVEGARARTHEGTGIGLALVRELVGLHGGTVDVRSEAGRGSTFQVTIPKGKDHLPPERTGGPRPLASTALAAGHYLEEALRWLPDGVPVPTTPRPAPAPAARQAASDEGPRPRIVWADDNADMREYVVRLLAPHYDVEAVADGEAALAAALRRPPDLMLADVMMPRLDGFGVLRGLRADERLRAVPVILLSARAGEESRVEGMGAGADDYLVKPFSARELLARVDAHLKMARERREGERALREREAWLAGQKEALQAAVNGEPLEVSLGALVRTAVEQLGGDARAAFYRAKPDGSELRHVVGMPDSYARCVDDFKIGPDSLACGLALSTGQPVLTGDVTKEPLWEPWLWLAERFEYRGCWSFPIHTSAGKFIGTFAVYRRQPREATRRDVEFASLLTHAAAIIMSRHTEAEVRQRAEEALRESESKLAIELADTRLLQRVSSSLARKNDVAALFDQILDAARAFMRSDMASIQRFAPERDELLLLAHKGLAPESAKFWERVRPGEATCCGVSLARGEPLIISDVERWDLVSGTETLAHYRLSGIRAVLSLPLVARDGRCVGIISTHWRETHRPSEREYRLLDVLARQAADLIERRNAEEALRESERRQAFLLELSDALRPLADPAEIEAAASRLLGERLGVNRAYYVEVEDDGEHVVVAADYADGVPSVAGRYHLDDYAPTLKDEYRAGRTVAIADTAADPRVPGPLRAAWDALRIRAMVGVPLVKGGRFVAALGVGERDPRPWTAEDIALVEETAERTWAAVERARAEAQVRRGRDVFYELVARCPLGVYVVDADFRLVEVSDGSRKVFAGVRPLIGRDFA
jgi:GAF domain-containing protein/AmiR/NasT family two-component response regulator